MPNRSAARRSPNICSQVPSPRVYHEVRLLKKAAARLHQAFGTARGMTMVAMHPNRNSKTASWPAWSISTAISHHLNDGNFRISGGGALSQFRKHPRKFPTHDYFIFETSNLRDSKRQEISLAPNHSRYGRNDIVCERPIGD
jgi:hypothetical protein